MVVGTQLANKACMMTESSPNFKSMLQHYLFGRVYRVLPGNDMLECNPAILCSRRARYLSVLDLVGVYCV